MAAIPDERHRARDIKHPRLVINVPSLLILGAGASRLRPTASHHCVAAESHRCSGGFRIKIQGRPQLPALAALS